jgi:hypothetical protein
MTAAATTTAATPMWLPPPVEKREREGDAREGKREREGT